MINVKPVMRVNRERHFLFKGRARTRLLPFEPDLWTRQPSPSWLRHPPHQMLLCLVMSGRAVKERLLLEALPDPVSATLIG